VNTAESTAAKFAAGAGFDEDEQSNIAMAVREAAVNAVLHGNAYDPDKKFFLAYESTDDSIVITITDQGQGLDPSNIPDPLAPENLMKGSGRGIFLIRAFMDEVKFRNTNPGTEITLIKKHAKEERQ
jgi:serine/threonine-protein kinase RsbW